MKYIFCDYYPGYFILTIIQYMDYMDYYNIDADRFMEMRNA